MFLHRATGRLLLLRSALRSWGSGRVAATRHLCSSSEPKNVEARGVGGVYQDILNLGISRPKPYEQQSAAPLETPKQHHSMEEVSAATTNAHFQSKVVVAEAPGIVVEETTVTSSTTTVVPQSAATSIDPLRRKAADPTAAKQDLKLKEEQEAKHSKSDKKQKQEDTGSKGRPSKAKKKTKFSYSATQWEDDPALGTPKAVEILNKFGLHQFAEVQPAKVNATLCDEFLSSYTHHGYGIVQSNVISITPEALEKVTGLPKGTEAMNRLTRDQAKTLKSVTKHMYNDYFVLNELKMAGDEESNQILAAVGRLLMTKLRGSKRSNAVVGRILWGIHTSWHSGTSPTWPAYLAELMRSAAHRTRTSNIPFPYGSWLTMLIEDALRDVVTVEGEQGEQGQGQGVLEASVNLRLLELRHKEEELSRREQELVKKEKKLKRFLASMTRMMEPTGTTSASSSSSSSSLPLLSKDVAASA